MDQKLVKININVGSRSYPLKVTAQEEASAREIEQHINAILQDIRSKYPDRDMVDCLNMSIIKLAFDRALPSDDNTMSQVLALQQMLLSAEQ